jgi:hypothetical protein
MDMMKNFMKILLNETITVIIVIGESIRNQKDERKQIEVQARVDDSLSSLIDYMISHYDIKVPFGSPKIEASQYGFYFEENNNNSTISPIVSPGRPKGEKITFLEDNEWLDVTYNMKHYGFTNGVCSLY